MSAVQTPQHKIESGFNAQSTAKELLQGLDLTGKLAIVTGGYSGIGLETTKALMAAGAHVVVPARRPEEAVSALDGTERVEVGELELADLELADLASVRPDTARELRRRCPSFGRRGERGVGTPPS